MALSNVDPTWCGGVLRARELMYFLQWAPPQTHTEGLGIPFFRET